MDGLEATTAIREKEKGSGLHQPVVALRAHAMKGDREKCMAGGMDGYLSKPIRPQELDRLLEIYVARRLEARSVTEPAMPPGDEARGDSIPLSHAKAWVGTVYPAFCFRSFCPGGK